MLVFVLRKREIGKDEKNQYIGKRFHVRVPLMTKLSTLGTYHLTKPHSTAHQCRLICYFYFSATASLQHEPRDRNDGQFGAVVAVALPVVGTACLTLVLRLDRRGPRPSRAGTGFTGTVLEDGVPDFKNHVLGGQYGGKNCHSKASEVRSELPRGCPLDIESNDKHWQRYL